MILMDIVQGVNVRRKDDRFFLVFEVVINWRFPSIVEIYLLLVRINSKPCVLTMCGSYGTVYRNEMDLAVYDHFFNRKKKVVDSVSEFP